MGRGEPKGARMDFPFRVRLDVNARYTISAVKINPGDRFLVRYVVLDECGKDLDIIDLTERCCKTYLGSCETNEDVGGAANPININTFMGYDSPGVYEFVPDGVVAATAMIHVKRWSETI